MHLFTIEFLPGLARTLEVLFEPLRNGRQQLAFTRKEVSRSEERIFVPNRKNPIVPKETNPALRLPASYSESDLKVIEWPKYHLEDWDFVLIRTRPAASQPYTPNDLTLDEHIGGWWLFKRVR